MKNFRGIFITALLLMANSIQLLAQDDLRLVPGMRVRVTASKFLQRVKGVSISRARRTEKLRYVGRVVTSNRDTLVIRAQGWDESFFIPFEFLKKLELSRGRKSNLGKGAKVGFLVGAGLGAIFGVVAGWGECPFGVADISNPDGCSTILGIYAGAFLGLLGTGIGAGVGAAHPGEVWEEVSLEELK